MRNLCAPKNRNNSVILGINQDTICAIATANGVGVIGIIRILGNKAFEISGKILSLNIWGGQNANHSISFYKRYNATSFFL